MLSGSEVFVVRLEKLIEDITRQYPDFTNAQLLGSLEVFKFTYLQSLISENHSDDDDENVFDIGT